MSARNATQKEVIDRLSVILHPARAEMPAAGTMAEVGEPGNGGASSMGPRPDIRLGAMQQRYRLYRVCGYGVVAAWYYAAKSPTW